MAAKTKAKKNGKKDEIVLSGVTDNPPTTESQWQPLTISEDGKPPKNRFKDAASLFSCWQQAQLESLRNDERLKDIRALYDGLPLDLGDISEQQTQNNGNFPNINKREFTRMVDDYAGNFVQIDCGGDSIADIYLKDEYIQGGPSQKVEWEQKLRKFFSMAIKEWDHVANAKGFQATSIAQYVMESGVRNLNMGLFGIGVAYFRDNIDWRWIAIPTRCVMVPNGTKITLRNNSIVYVRRTYTATELYAKAKKKGWNTKEIYRTLYYRLSENLPGSVSRVPFSDIENWIRNNESLLQRDYRQIFLIEALSEEFPDADGNKGGVTKYIISEQGPNRAFLYVGDREYETVQQALVAVTDAPGPEGDWHGVKGYGDQLYDIATQNNLLWNHFVTMAIITSTPMFQSGSSDDRQKLSQMVWSRMGVLLPGLTLSQVKINADLSGVEAASEQGMELLQDTARNYPQQETQPNSNTTATEATLRAQKEAQLSTRQILMYRSVGLDRLFSEMYRRLTNQDYPVSWPGGVAAKNFRDRCKMAGIPVQAYCDPQEVRASRNGGSGNASLDYQRAMQVLQVATPGFGQQEAKKEVVASLVSDRSEVARFIQDVPPQDSDDVTITLEHCDLTEGQLMQAISFQNHQKHLGTPDPSSPSHLGILASARQTALQMLDAGVQTQLPDAQKLSRVMDATVQHCGMHMQFLGQMLQFTRNKDLEQMVKQLGSALATFQKFAQSFDQAIARAMKGAQPQQPQMSAEEQIKLDKWQVEKQIKLAEAQNKMQIDTARSNQQLGAEAQRHAINLQYEQQKHDQKLGAMGETTLLQNRISAVQAGLDGAQQANQNMQTLQQNAQQHSQELNQAQQVHNQSMANTQAQHNLEQVQQAQEQSQQETGQASNENTD